MRQTVDKSRSYFISAHHDRYWVLYVHTTKGTFDKNTSTF